MSKLLKLLPHTKNVHYGCGKEINCLTKIVKSGPFRGTTRTTTINCRDVKVKKLIGPFELGEGPHWDNQCNVLLFVDIHGKTVNRYNPAIEEHKQIKLEKYVTAVVPLQGSREDYIIGHGLDISRLQWDGHSSNYCVEKLHSVEADKPENRFNDGKADKQGNLWIGTMSETKDNEGALYKYSKNGTVMDILKPVSISNGMAWSKDNTRMFYIDSPTKRIDVFQFDAKTSCISCRKEFFDLTKNDIPGVPDGMTIDSDDNLWVAIWEGRRIINIDGRTGELLRTVRIPAPQVTSAVFGGVDLKTLYVTTARKHYTPQQIAQEPMAGYLFAVEGLGVTGTQSNTVTFTC